MKKPIDLWNDIARKFTENTDKIKQKYYLTKEYTALLTKLLVELGNSSNKYDAVDLEYWPRVDVSYFDKYSESNWSEWCREVAIEIENNSEDWEQELDKLFSINAGLKVLITYWDASKNEIIDYLTKEENGSFQSIYKSRKYHQEKDEYLLIFGPSSYENITGGCIKDFTAFSFDGKSVKKLEEKVILQKRVITVDL